MRHHRHTITVASSTLFFVCLMLHAQTGLCSLASTSHNDAEARKVYGSILPADWTLTTAYGRRLHTVLSPVAFNMDTVLDASHTHSLLSGTDTSYVLESKAGVWNSLRWRSTSRAWAS